MATNPFDQFDAATDQSAGGAQDTPQAIPTIGAAQTDASTQPTTTPSGMDQEIYRSTIDHLVNSGATRPQIEAFVKNAGYDVTNVHGLDAALSYRDSGGKERIPVFPTAIAGAETPEAKAPPGTNPFDQFDEKPHDWKDEVGIGARAVASSIASTAGSVMNWLTDNEFGNAYTDATDWASDKMGLAKPQTDEERLGSALVSGATGGLLTAPLGGEGAIPALASTLSGAGAGGASELVRQHGGNELEQIGAGLAGGFLAPGGIAAASRLAPTIARLGDPILAGFSNAAVQRVARRTITDAATDMPSVLQHLRNGTEELVPGSDATLYQATGDLGLGGLERRTATANPSPFIERENAQNAARISALGELGSGGDPMAVQSTLKAGIDALDHETSASVARATMDAQAAHEAVFAESNARIAKATERAQGSAAAIPDTTPEANGQAIRDAAEKAEQAASARARGLYEAVDPNGKLTANTLRTSTAARDIISNEPATAKPMTGEEAAIFDAASAMEPVSPARDLVAMSQRVNAAMRQELMTNGRTPTYARLSQLRGAIQDNLTNTISDQVVHDNAMVAKGSLAPEDAVAARIQKWRDEYESAKRSGTFGKEGAGGSTGVGATANAGHDGAGLPAERGLGSSAGDQGVSGSAGGGVAADAPQPVPESQFKKWVAHIDLRARKGGTGDANRSAIASDGFSQSNSVNALPVWMGGKPSNVVEQNYMPRKGDTVYLVPPEGFTDKANGAQVNVGWKPGPGQVVKVEHDGQSLYDLYKKALSSESDVAANGTKPTFDDAARDRLLLANSVYRSKMGTFGRGPLNDILRKAGMSDVYRLPAEAVPAKIWTKGPVGQANAQALVKGIGEGPAIEMLTDVAAASLRKAALRDDGTINPAAYSKWRNDYSEALKVLPPDIQAKFGLASQASGDVARTVAERALIDKASAKVATQTIQQAEIARTAQMQAAQAGAIGRIMGVTDPVEVSRMIGSMLGRNTSVTEMRDLVGRVQTDPVALDGLRQAVADHINEKFISAINGEPIKAAQFQQFLRDKRAALGQVFSKDQLQSMDTIAADLKRSQMSQSGARLKNASSATAQDSVASRIATSSTMRRTMLALIADHAGGFGAGIGTVAADALRASGIKNANDLVTRAMLDPAFAHELLKNAPPEGVDPPMTFSKAAMRSAISAGLAVRN